MVAPLGPARRAVLGELAHARPRRGRGAALARARAALARFRRPVAARRAAGARAVGRAAQAARTGPRAGGGAALILLDEPGAGVNPALLEIDRRTDRRAEPAGHHLPDHRAQHGSRDDACAGPVMVMAQGRLLMIGDAGRGAARSARDRGLSRRSRRVSGALRRRRYARSAATSPGCRSCAARRFSVAPDEIVALLGPNGAGKSTLVKAVAGLVPVSRGRVLLHGRDITGRAGASLGRTRASASCRRPRTCSPISRSRKSRACRRDLKVAEAAAARRSCTRCSPTSTGSAGSLAGRLSGGQRQMLAVARALVGAPQVLMLDEPSAGLSPKLVGARVREASRRSARPASRSCWSSRT